MDTVTKLKSEGRVAAGKRLAEWNKKQKENLVKNRKEVATSGDSSNLSSAPSDQQSASQVSSHTVLYSGGALAVLVVGVGAALYLYRGKIASDSTPSKAPPSEPDIFRMN